MLKHNYSFKKIRLAFQRWQRPLVVDSFGMSFTTDLVDSVTRLGDASAALQIHRLRIERLAARFRKARAKSKEKIASTSRENSTARRPE